MVGNEYTLATTCFQVGAILGGIPSNLLLTWVPPRILLPGLELLWGIFTLVTYKVTSANQVSSSSVNLISFRARLTMVGVGRSSTLCVSSSVSSKAPHSSVSNTSSVRALSLYPPMNPSMLTLAD